MKKILVITVALVMMVVLAGCGGTGSSSEQIIFKSEGELPNLMAVSDGTYYIMAGEYDEEELRQLSVSEELDKLNFVYDAEDVRIDSLCAEGDIAAWVEIHDKSYDYKLYDREKDETISFNSADRNEKETQNAQIGIYNDTLYYIELDYGENKIFVKGYNVKEEKTEIVHEEILPEHVTTALDVSGQVLTAYIGGDQMYSLNLESGEEKTVEIPEKPDGIMEVSYDQGNDIYALYYTAKGTGPEDIGIFTPGDKQIKSIFRSTDFAYPVHLEIDNGHVFWLTSINTAGTSDNEADYNTLMDYSCQDDATEEYPSTFGFALSDDTLFTLSFVGDTDEVAIERIER